MPLTLANTAVRGYHLQQTLGQARKKGDTNYQPPPPPPELPPVFVCVSTFDTTIDGLYTCTYVL